MSASERPAPATGTGLSENAPARKLLASQNSGAGGPVTPLPLRWAKALLDGADGPVPEYGSPEFAALPDDSRSKVASCVLAAERWRTRYHRAEFLQPSGSRRAREIAEARRPRPGDYTGGPVAWDEVAAGE